MRIDCKIEPSDYVKAQYIHYRPRPLVKWVGIAFLALSILMGLQQVVLPTEDRAPVIVIAVVGLLCWIIGFWFFLIPYNAKKIYKQQKALQEPFEAEITEEGLIVTSRTGSGRVAWADFHKYKLASDFILLYHSDVIFHMFPKRWFSEDDFQELITILKNTLGPPKP